MIKILLNPKIFNNILLTLFALAAIRWSIAGNPRQTIYWIGAFILNFAITYIPE